MIKLWLLNKLKGTYKIQFLVRIKETNKKKGKKPTKTEVKTGAMVCFLIIWKPCSWVLNDFGNHIGLLSKPKSQACLFTELKVLGLK